MTMQSLLDHETINDETHIQKKKKSEKTTGKKWKNEHDTSKKLPIC